MKTLDLCCMSADMTRELNNIAEKSRKIYTELVDRLSQKYSWNPNWWVTPFVSRDTSQCTAFNDYCLVRLAINKLNTGEYNRIVVPKKILYDTIKLNVQRSDIGIKIKESKDNFIKRKFSSLYEIYNIINIYKRIHTVKKNSNGWDTEKINKKVILIDTYIISSQFKNGKYVDRYFSGLADNTEENILFLAQLEFDNLKEGGELARKAESLDNFILFEKYVSAKDFMEIINYVIASKKFSFEKCIIDGLDICPIVNGALRQGASNLTAMYGILKGNVVCRLSDKYKLEIKKLIGWYEGQPSSNGMFCKFRRNNDNIPTIAYIYSPCPENNIGLYPSKMQNKEKKVAEYYAVGGAAWINNIKQFDKKTKCCIAPAFRYGYIRTSNGSFEGGDKVILILSGVLEIAKLQLRNALSALIDIGYSDVLIKNHPFYSKNRLNDYGIEEEYVSRINAIFKDGNLADAVRESNIAIVSETSSSLELILNSLKVINYVPNGKLSYACVPEKFRECVAMAYSADEIKKALHYYTDNPEQFDLREMQEECFEKVSNEAIRRFFEKENYK